MSSSVKKKRNKISRASWAAIVILLAFVVGYVIVAANPHAKDGTQAFANGLIYMFIAIALCLVIHWIRTADAALRRKSAQRNAVRNYRKEQVRKAR